MTTIEYEKLLQEMRKAFDNLQVLTHEDLQKLKGKRIQTIYFGYSHQDGVNDFIVGTEKSMYDIAKENKDFQGFESQAEYWESIMTENELNQYKNTLEIITADGKKTRIRRYSNKHAYFCSDDDRYVYFRIVE